MKTHKCAACMVSCNMLTHVFNYMYICGSRVADTLGLWGVGLVIMRLFINKIAIYIIEYYGGLQWLVYLCLMCLIFFSNKENNESSYELFSIALLMF